MELHYQMSVPIHFSTKHAVSIIFSFLSPLTSLHGAYLVYTIRNLHLSYGEATKILIRTSSILSTYCIMIRKCIIRCLSLPFFLPNMQSAFCFSFFPLLTSLHGSYPVYEYMMHSVVRRIELLYGEATKLLIRIHEPLIRQFHITMQV